MKCDRTKMWICICTLISNSAYALIAPFLPIEFKEKGIQGGSIGMIFMVYSISMIFLSPLVSTIIVKFGERNLISIGNASMGGCFILFGLVDNMQNYWLIMVYAIVLRMLQGACSSMV